METASDRKIPMDTLDQEHIEMRSLGRRREDLLMINRGHRHSQLFQVGQTLTSEINLDALFEIVMDQTNQIMDTERSAVFLNDEESGELWSLVATGMTKNEIRIPVTQGVAGWVFQSGMPLTINDAYEDHRFYSSVDEKSGFRTRNILCLPLTNRKGQCIGVLQALNKRTGDFTEEDTELLTSISHYVAIALENSRLYEKLKSTLLRIETLEKVKNHLTKFVPSSVAKLVEQDPHKLESEKTPTDVSILFIDIEGFSKITEELDQVLVNDMVESHFSAYLDCITRYGGEVNETSGDGLMIIFKEASQKENDQNAVAAAMEIISENHRLNDELQFGCGRINLHLGLNSGTALVGSTKMKSLSGERWTYTASGLVTVLAARIGALSRECRLYIGPETQKNLDESYECEFLGLRELKNIKNPVPIYHVKSVGDKHTTSQKVKLHGLPLSSGYTKSTYNRKAKDSLEKPLKMCIPCSQQDMDVLLGA